MKNAASLSALTLAVAALVGCRASAPTTSTAKDAAPPQVSTDWCHAPMLRSQDAVNIALDYQVTRHSLGGNSIENRADSAWLNISKFGFNGSEQVNVIITTAQIGSGYIFENNLSQYQSIIGSTQPIALQWDSNAQKFTGTVPGGLNLGDLSIGDDQSYPSILYISAQVNGTWQVDPLQAGAGDPQDHNFRFFPYQDMRNNSTPPVCTGDIWDQTSGF